MNSCVAESKCVLGVFSFETRDLINAFEARAPLLSKVEAHRCSKSPPGQCSAHLRVYVIRDPTVTQLSSTPAIHLEFGETESPMQFAEKPCAWGTSGKEPRSLIRARLQHEVPSTQAFMQSRVVGLTTSLESTPQDPSVAAGDPQFELAGKYIG